MIKAAFARGIAAGERLSERRQRTGERRHLAAALLGTRDPRCGRPDPTRGLHPSQPRETRPHRPRCGLAVFVISPLRRAGRLSTGLGRRISSARVEFRVALLSEGGIRFAIPPYEIADLQE